MTVVEICGGIAYGKTTLAHLLRNIPLVPVLEDFQQNPFYSAFYQDPTAVAFETEVTFSLQHYHQLKQARGSKIEFCADFSLYLDRAYSKVTLQGEQLATYLRVYDLVRNETGPPTLLIHLNCDPEVALDRIKRRGRSSELGIQLNYLKALDHAVADSVSAAAAATNILSLSSHDLDFASDDVHKERVLAMVRAALQRAETR